LPYQRLEAPRALSFKAKQLQLTISDSVVHDEVCRLSNSGTFGTNALDVLGAAAPLSFAQFEDLVETMAQLLGKIQNVANLIDKMAEVGHCSPCGTVYEAERVIASSICKHGLDDIVRCL
jgi:hypothetical protein